MMGNRRHRLSVVAVQSAEESQDIGTPVKREKLFVIDARTKLPRSGPANLA